MVQPKIIIETLDYLKTNRRATGHLIAKHISRKESSVKSALSVLERLNHVKQLNTETVTLYEIRD